MLPFSPDSRAPLALAQALRDHLVRGFALDMETVTFIDATVTVDRAEELTAILGDPGNDAAEPLLDLIFYPDRYLQEKLEEILGRADFTRTDIDCVVDQLMDPPVSVPLIFPDFRGGHGFTPDREVISRMVERLHPDRPIPETILRACQVLPEGMSRKVRVCIRNSHAAKSGKAAEFVAAFVSRTDLQNEDFLDILQAGLEILGNLSPNEDIFTGLSRLRREIVSDLSRAQRMAEEASGKNMETLMLQGARQPYINAETARQTIRHLDLLCRTVFGRIDLAGPAPCAEDLGTIVDPEDLNAIMQRLS